MKGKQAMELNGLQKPQWGLGGESHIQDTKTAGTNTEAQREGGMHKDSSVCSRFVFDICQFVSRDQTEVEP